MPKSNTERLCCCVILYAGIIELNYFKNVIIGMFDQFEALMVENDSCHLMPLFLGVIQDFNGKIAIKNEFKTEIENFFEYRSLNDKSVAINNS